MITSKGKLELCNKYYIYLLLINSIGGGSMMALQEQVINGVIALGIDNKRTTVLRNLLQLKRGGVIKEQRFIKNSRFLILKKFAIRYLKNELLTDSISSVPIRNTNAFYYKNIFKGEYFLRQLVQYIIDDKRESRSIEEYIKYRCTSFLASNEFFMWNLMEDFFFEVNKNEVKKDAKLLKHKREVQQKILKKEILEANYIENEEFNISNLTSRGIIINTCILNEEKREFRVEINYLDYKDKQDIQDIIYVYYIAYSVFRRLIKFNFNIYIDIEVCTNNIQACKNIKQKLLKVKKEDSSGKHTKIDELLNKYNVNPAFLKIKLVSYYIVSQYFK